MNNKLTPPPLSLYVHLPWCVRKCPYCDFNSHAVDGEVPEDRYITALLKDLELQAPQAAGRELQTIFMGGGTPSLFTPDAIARLIDGIRTRLTCAPDMEVTMEANPGTIEHGRFTGYRAAGINRVSLGGQTFNARHLQALGRIHDSDDTRNAAEELHAAGLTNFNIDLMYALPGQTIAEAQADLRTALALEPAHVSHYQLTLEPGTVFYHRPPELPDDDTGWDMQLRCQALLAEHGYEQYEISAYAPPQRRCRHNLNYWRFGDYLGIGAGAHGKLTEAARIWRTERPRHPRRYMSELEDGTAALQTREVKPEERSFEFMLNSLRLIEGFDREMFESRTGLPIGQIDAVLATALQRGLLQADAAGWRATSLGLQFLNDLQLFFLPAEPVTTRLQPV